MKLSNLKSPNGNKVPNQFAIEYGTGVEFQSYKSTCAIVTRTASGHKLKLGRDWAYSVTTSKYRTMFLNEYFIPTPEMIAIVGKRVNLKTPDLEKLIKAGLVEFDEELF